MEILFVLILGFIMGSFLNVVGLRIPIGESVTKPARSYCPNCRHVLQGIDLLPVFSYLIHWGKCRYCKIQISLLYPIIEILTGLIFILVVWKYGWNLETVVYLFIVSSFVAVSVSDVRYQVIPDRVILPVLLISFILLGMLQGNWLELLWGVLAGAVIVVLIILGSRGGMGGGDIRLNSLIGLLLGWKLMLVSFMLACILGSLIGGSLLLTQKISRKTKIPFGPYLAASAVITLLFGEQMLNRYLQMVVGG